MLLRCYHYLHPMEKFEVECANQTIDANFRLDIFQQTLNTHEPMAELVTKEM